MKVLRLIYIIQNADVKNLILRVSPSLAEFHRDGRNCTEMSETSPK